MISRFKLLITSIGHPAIGLFLGAMFLDNLNFTAVPVFIALHFAITILACNLNCLYDYEVDKIYKKEMSRSVDILGKNNISFFIFIEIIIIFILILYLFSLDLMITGIVGLFGIAAAITYSVEPIRVKKRGLLSPVPVMFGIYFLPIIGGWFVFQNTINIYFIIFLIGYMLMNEGYTLVNTVEDHAEDRSQNIKTWSHVLGVRRTLRIAFAFSLAGLLCPASLFWLFEFSGEGFLLYLKYALVLFSAVVILKSALEVGEVLDGRDLEARAKIYGKRLPKWFVMGRYPMMLALFVLLL